MDPTLDNEALKNFGINLEECQKSFRNLSIRCKNEEELMNIGRKSERVVSDNQSKGSKSEFFQKVFHRQIHIESEVPMNSNLDDEIILYLNERKMKRVVGENVLVWWAKRSIILPKLHSIAKDVFAVQASSVPCERLFSHASNFFGKKRTQINTQKFRESFCLSMWINQPFHFIV